MNGKFVIHADLNNLACILASVCDMLFWVSAFNFTCNKGEKGMREVRRSDPISGSGEAVTDKRREGGSTAD